VIAHALTPFGTTVFAEISRLALAHGAVNLGQGFPDFDGPEWIRRAAAEAMLHRPNQYAPTNGLPELTAAIAHRWRGRTGMEVDPAAMVTVTAGCTEAIAAAMLGILNPGDEVVVFEPFYDSYRACIAMAGATPRFVVLRWPAFSFDPADLTRAITPRTRAILVNTPHNPTGKVFSRAELGLIAELCVHHDLIAITDEVYEDLAYDADHVSLATLPGMAERTVTLSSIGKTFSVTGWKIGWAVAPAPLTKAVRAAHQFLTFAVNPALQAGAAAALGAPESFYIEARARFVAARDMLADRLEMLGFAVSRPAGGYFVMADHTRFGHGSDTAFVKHLIETVGVAAIPPSAFYHDHPEEGRRLARFAFCKKPETIVEACRRLETLRASLP
jgi:aspartate/methionine/tyrosine aminotransferase